MVVWVLGEVCGGMAAWAVRRAMGRGCVGKVPAGIGVGDGGGKERSGEAKPLLEVGGKGAKEEANFTSELTSVEEEAAGKTQNSAGVGGDGGRGGGGGEDEEDGEPGVGFYSHGEGSGSSATAQGGGDVVGQERMGVARSELGGDMGGVRWRGEGGRSRCVAREVTADGREGEGARRCGVALGSEEEDGEEEGEGAQGKIRFRMEETDWPKRESGFGRKTSE